MTGIAAAYTYSKTPIYTAKATFYLAATDNAGRREQGHLRRHASTTSNTYVAVLGSPAVQDPLRERLGLPPGTPIDVQRAR